MAELPTRLRDLLRDPTDDLMQARIWRRMVAKSLAERSRRAKLRRAAPVWATATVAATAVLFATARAFLPGSPGPLALESGEALTALSAPRGGAPVVHDFTGGSRLILLPGASIRVAENDDAAAIFFLEQGGASFELADDGRRWTLECSLATIEGTAAKFFVEREERRLRVMVEAGAVSVRGAGVQGGVQRLAAGVSLEVVSPDRAATSAKDAALEEEVADEGVVRRRVLAALEPRGVAKVKPREAGDRDPNSRAALDPNSQSASNSDPRSAAESDPRAVAPESTPSEESAPDARELLLRADRARVEGRAAEAAKLFAELLQRYPNDLAAPIAAFTLGRVELESLHRPAQAAIAFERALHLGLGMALREVALGHLADAYQRAGDSARAGDAAARYLADYPEGRRAAEMKTLRAAE